MASLSNDRGGLRRILFKASDGKRKPLRLGHVSKSQAATILAHVNRLEACQFDGSAPPPQTAAWLSGISDDLRAKLVKGGLAAPAEKPVGLTLGELVGLYKARPRWQELKASTHKNQEKAFRYLLGHFGDGKLAKQFSEADAEDYRAKLSLDKAKSGKGLAKSTANRACAIAWALFRYAIRARIVDRNPFEEVARGHATRGDNVLVAASDCVKVLAELPDCQWRLLFALARYGGLRMPSEPRRLRWCDVDWDRGRLLIHSPKTEGHDGKATRWIPMFPELEKLLAERFDEAEPGDTLVLPMMARWADSTFASVVERAITRAEVERWPRMWHSLRSTRQTELEQSYPSYVVCAWLGNSEAVARKHYLIVGDEHFEKAAQNAAQTASANPRTDATSDSGEVEDTLDSRIVAKLGGD